jgi:hypothetical protein
MNCRSSWFAYDSTSAGVPGVVPVRDSKKPGPALVASPDAWWAFLGQVKG